MTFEIRTFDRADTDAVIALWTEAGLVRPWNDPRLDIERKLSVQPELFRVAIAPSSGTVIGSVMAGYDGHRGWLYYVASARSHREQGVATALVADAERRLLDMGCPKVQLMVREDNEAVLGFYETLGYERFHVANAGRRLVVDG